MTTTCTVKPRVGLNSRYDTDVTDRILGSSMEKLKLIRLGHYEEIVGPLHRLDEFEGVLLAEIARNIVALPLEMAKVLYPHLGRKVAILHTDIPQKEYVFRIFPE